jgi:hypothetical protein
MSSYSKVSNGKSRSFVQRHKIKIVMGLIIAAVLIAGFLLSGGTIPNSNIGYKTLPVYKTGMGAINGYIGGPLGLPAVGTTIIAAQQGGKGVTENAVISIDGKYVFSSLPPGQYILMVAYPDGTNRVLNNVIVDTGSIQTINIKY